MSNPFMIFIAFGGMVTNSTLASFRALLTSDVTLNQVTLFSSTDQKDIS